MTNQDYDKALQNLTNEVNELKAANIELEKSLISLNETTKKTAKTDDDLAKKTNANTDAVKKLTKAQKAEAEILRLSTKEGKKEIDAQVRLTEARKKARLEAQKNNGILKKTGGLFKSMTKSILAAGVAFLSFRAAFNVIKSSISTITKFEQGMSKVRAVAGALPKEFKALTANAKLLGQTTSKSALQVAGLQLEFSKLGFSTKEILNATEATIQLSIAAGSDLAESAVIAASTVRGFGLDAKDTQRTVDIMAKSFASSALDIEKFKTGMGIAAPIARAFGKDVEFTTAQLSVLADAGIDASTAGTSLRNILLELSKNGLTWDEGLQKINNSTNKNTTALDLFGKRGATAALVLADNTEKAIDLEKAYRDSAGAAKRMATIMEDNLIGDTTKLSSVWEGLVLSINSGAGSFNKFLRGAVQGVTSLVSSFQKLIEGSPVEEIKSEREEIIKLSGAIQNANLSEEDRLLALDKLKLLAPEVAKGVTLEAESYEELNKQLDEYLDKAIQRIAIASLEEEETKAIAKAAKQRVNQAEALRRAFEVLTVVNDEYRVSEGGLQEQLEGTRAALQKVVDAQFESGEAVRSIDVARTKEQEQLGALNLAYANLTTAKEKETKITEDSVNPISERIALLKDEFGLTEDLTDVAEENAKVIEDSNIEIVESDKKKYKELLKNAKRFGVDLKAENLKRTQETLDSFKLFQDELEAEIEFQVDREVQAVEDSIQAQTDARQKGAQDAIDIEKLKEDGIQEVKFAAYDAAGEIANNLFAERVDEELNSFTEAEEAKNDVAKSFLDSQLNNLQLQLDNKQISEEQYLAGKEKAETEYEKKLKASKLRIRQEEAKSEKKKALFDIAISTAVGIVKALALGPPQGFVLAAIVAGLGIAQAAVVAAKPIPKFEKGTNGQLKVSTEAIVGEKGEELVTLPDGNAYLTPDKPTRTFLPAGSEVFPHESVETKVAMAGGMSEKHYNGLVKSNKEIVKAIKEQKHISKSGSYDIIESMNNRLKIKSRILD